MPSFPPSTNVSYVGTFLIVPAINIPAMISGIKASDSQLINATRSPPPASAIVEIAINHNRTDT